MIPRSVPSLKLHWLWFSRFDVRVAILSVVDDFGNLVPVRTAHAACFLNSNPSV